MTSPTVAIQGNKDSSTLAQRAAHNSSLGACGSTGTVLPPTKSRASGLRVKGTIYGSSSPVCWPAELASHVGGVKRWERTASWKGSYYLLSPSSNEVIQGWGNYEHSRIYGWTVLSLTGVRELKNRSCYKKLGKFKSWTLSLMTSMGWPALSFTLLSHRRFYK